ncbi:response regulator [Penaeicola halotolerans]|uniref:response regulator n=1 Tax=Penaeicola halotolerans TaxID=2793196 RepID=UPI001CF85E4C|nr:response regulator [Penaeicola halotolerans]
MSHIQLIMIDDSSIDTLLVTQAIKRLEIKVDLLVFQEPQKGLDYLLSTERDETISYIVLLDLNMPDMDGFELLTSLRASHVPASHIKVLIFSTSNYHNDVEKAYKLGANAYLVKPVENKHYTEILQAVIDFWSKSM